MWIGTPRKGFNVLEYNAQKREFQKKYGHLYTRPFRIEEGKTYRNGRGDFCGPMEERTPGCFIDQHGAIYHPNGHEWNHVVGSTANLIEEIRT